MSDINKLELDQLTELIIMFENGYRMTQCNGFKWRVGDSDYYGGKVINEIPISAGSRLISPEEVDDSLCDALHIDPNPTCYEEYLCSYWEKYDGYPNTISSSPFPKEKIFNRYDNDNYGIYNNPNKYRDELATTRMILYGEVRKLCSDNGINIDNGLLLALNKCPNPFKIFEEIHNNPKLYADLYMGDINCITTIKNQSHNIMIITFN